MDAHCPAEQLTPAELKDKLKDRTWRLNNLYWIIDEKGRKVRFRMRPIQRLFYLTLWWLNIILKSRQHGFTTFICLYFLDMCLFNSNVRAGIIAQGLKEAQAIFRDKIKFPYEHLPEAIKKRIPAVKDDANELMLANNSSIRVGTSMRSGTLQALLITEYGKICAKFPQKAEEIKTGALETVHQGSLLVIESTAEGNFGDFHARCETAQALAAGGAELGPMDWKFFFFAWHQKPENRTDPAYVQSPPILTAYFAALEAELGKKLDAAQKAWYAKKYESMGPVLIKREHPSTPREAFEASIDGAYYGADVGLARDQGRVLFLPHEKELPVHTAWDLGIADSMSIIFWQVVGNEIRLIDYYEDNNKSLEFCIRYCQRLPYVYGKHGAPHDIRVRDLSTGMSRLEFAKSLNWHFDVLATDKISILDGIDLVRRLFHRFFFDAEKCKALLKALAAYRKEYNEKLERYEDHPLHDWSSHAASSLKSLAVMYKTLELRERIEERLGGGRESRTSPLEDI